MPEGLYPVQWAGGQAVVALPEHIGASNAGQVRDELLSVINHGATTLIADMTATVSCDHAGADAIVRAWRRADSNGTELRLVVTAGRVSRVLDLRGLDRQVSVYPSLEAATAARLPVPAAVLTTVLAAARRRAGQTACGAAAAPAMAGGLLDALQDGAAVTDGDGVIAAASTRLEVMFGYSPGELHGLPVESLVPARLHDAHRRHRSAWARSPSPRPMGSGLRLAGLRKDGTTFPVRVGLTPVTTASGQLTLAIVRDITRTGPIDDLAVLAQDAAAQRQEYPLLLDAVVNGLFQAGLSLQAAAGLPAEAARQGTEAVLGELDGIIRQIRDVSFAEPGPHPPRSPGEVAP